MDYLSTMQADLNGKVTDIINNFGGGTETKTTTQQFDYRPAEGAGWVIHDPKQIATFKSTGVLDFTILIDGLWAKENFNGMAQVVATDFTVEVRGAKTSTNQLFVRLAHSGQAPFHDKAGKSWLFSHVPVSTSYKYDISDGKHLAGGALSGVEGLQIGLSPFTTWHLSVSVDDNCGLSREGVDQIVLKFKGRYVQTNEKAAGLSRPTRLRVGKHGSTGQKKRPRTAQRRR
jgi:hypothetical protein